MPIEKGCERCGQTFKVRPRDAGQRFCGRVCKTAYEFEFGRAAARVANVNFRCRECGKPFSYKPSYVRAYNKKFGKDPTYCSMPCSDKGRRKDTDTRLRLNCIQCGKEMPDTRQPGGTINRKRRLCSTECRSLFRRLSYQATNATQQPTRRAARHGYIRMIVPGKNGLPSRDVLEHRYVMEQHLERRLLPEETVHHVNGNRQDNSLENLELFSSRHGPGQRVVDKVQFAIEILTLYPDFAKAAGYELRPAEHPSDAPRGIR